MNHRASGLLITVIAGAACIGLLTGCGRGEAGQEESLPPPSPGVADETEPGTVETAQEFPQAPTPDPEAEEALSATEFRPTGGSIIGYDVEIVGAELFKDLTGEDAIRVYWDFTNTSNDTIPPRVDLAVEMEQEGRKLSETLADLEEAVPEYGNSWRLVRPGVTIRCVSEYKCDPDGGPITFRLGDWKENLDSMVVTFAPEELSGRPETDWVAEQVKAPKWTDGLDYRGDLADAHMEIKTSELDTNWQGHEMMRVHFEYTNNGRQYKSMEDAVSVRAFQDGVELDLTWANEPTAEDEQYSRAAAGGETVMCSCAWVLRSDSPVEVEVAAYASDTIIGYVFDGE